MVYSRNKGNGGTYEYFVCISRKTKRRPCSQTSIRLEKIEAGIARFYEGLHLAPHHVVTIQEAVRRELASERLVAEEDATRARKRLEALSRERQKLLRAHYDDVVPLDLLKAEMLRITRETSAAQAAIAAADRAIVELDDTLERALLVATHCEREYITAPPRVRRQINQGLFERLYIGRDGDVVTWEMTEPFSPLLGSRLEDAQMHGENAETMTPQEESAVVPEGVSDDRERPSDVFTRTFGRMSDHAMLGDLDATESLTQNTNGHIKMIFSGLHMDDLVPPVGFEPTL